MAVPHSLKMAKQAEKAATAAFKLGDKEAVEVTKKVIEPTGARKFRREMMDKVSDLFGDLAGPKN